MDTHFSSRRGDHLRGSESGPSWDRRSSWGVGLE